MRKGVCRCVDGSEGIEVFIQLGFYECPIDCGARGTRVRVQCALCSCLEVFVGCIDALGLQDDRKLPNANEALELIPFLRCRTKVGVRLR